MTLKCICRLHGTGTICGRNVRWNLLNRKIFYSLNYKGMSDTYNKDTKLNFNFPVVWSVDAATPNGEYNLIMGTTLCFNNWFHLSGQHTHTHTHTHTKREKGSWSLRVSLGCIWYLFIYSVTWKSSLFVFTLQGRFA